MLTYRTHPFRIHYPAWPLSVRGISYIYRMRFRTGPHPRSRARGGLVRFTARTTRTLPCRPGTVPIKTTAATRLLYRNSRSRCRHSRHTLLRVTTPRLHSTTFTLTPGDAAACSRMATDISRVYSDLTHAVTLPTHGRSLTHRASLTHTIPLTPTGALTRGVSSTQAGCPHTRAASRAHVVSSPCGAPFTHGVPGSTHAGTLVNTPLAHGVSFAPGGSSKHGVALTHEVSLGVALTHAL